VRWTYWDPPATEPPQPAGEADDAPSYPRTTTETAPSGPGTARTSAPPLSPDEAPVAAPDKAPTAAPDKAPVATPTYGPLELSRGPNMGGRFTGRDFVVGEDGLPRCPAGVALVPHEHHLLPNRDRRVRFAAPVGACRTCEHRSRCVPPQSTRGRRVSGVYRAEPSAPHASNGRIGDPAGGAHQEPATASSSSGAPPERRSLPPGMVLELSQGPRVQGRYGGQDFTIGPDGLPRCPTGHPLTPREWYPQDTGEVRVRCAARLAACRACPQRSQCLPPTARGGRRITGVYRVGRPPPAPADAPTDPGVEPGSQGMLWWGDAGGRQVRRGFVTHLRQQQVTVRTEEPIPALPAPGPVPPPGAGAGPVQSRAQRSHQRLSWHERWTRNVRAAEAPSYQVEVAGVAPQLRAALGMPTGP
jgi:hypothetical protein